MPKGKSFDDLAQEDVNLMMDHINSYRRKKLNGKSLYEAFCFYYGEGKACERLGTFPLPFVKTHKCNNCGTTW